MLSIYLILVGPYFLWPAHLPLVHVMPDVVHIPHSCWPLLPLTCTPPTCSCHAWCCPYTSFLLAPTSSDLYTSHLFMSCLMLSIYLILVGPYFLWPAHLSLVHVMRDVVHRPHSCWPLLPLTCTPLTYSCHAWCCPYTSFLLAPTSSDLHSVHRPHSCWPLLPLTCTPLTCSCHAWCCPYTSFLLAPTSSDLHSVHRPHSCWPLLPLTCTPLTCSYHAWYCPYTSFL